MQKPRSRLTRRLATVLVVFALAGGWAANARADIAYAFAAQSISNIVVTTSGAGGVTALVTTSSINGAAVSGSGISNSAALDAPQAYLGGAPPAPENFFFVPPVTTGRYAPGSPPVSPVGDFTRSDSQILNPTLPTNSARTVAESYINSTTGKFEDSSSVLTATFNFTQTAAGTLTIRYDFSNDIFRFSTGAGTATGDFRFGFTISTSAGVPVFSSASDPATSSRVNVNLTAPPQGPELSNINQTNTVLTPTLVVGDYSIVFTSSATSHAVVPEPNVVSLVAAGGALTLVVGAMRRRTRRSVTK